MPAWIWHLVSARVIKDQPARSLSMFHLVTARVIKDSIRVEHLFTGEDAHAFSFGEQRFLTGCKNRLWTMTQYPEQRGEPMYKHDWHRTGEFIEFDYIQGVRYEWLDGKRMDVEQMKFQMFFESDDVEAHFGMRRALWGYDIIDVTFKLILLQRWFRKSLHALRRERRLALAMALHPRLGDGSWLSNIPTELARTLVPAAT